MIGADPISVLTYEYHTPQPRPVNSGGGLLDKLRQSCYLDCESCNKPFALLAFLK